MWWQRRSGRNRDMTAQLATLNERLQELAQQLAERPIQVTVERVHVDRANLERLVFQLERLDIQELSGSLNLGNNFTQPALQQARFGAGRRLPVPFSSAGHPDAPQDTDSGSPGASADRCRPDAGGLDQALVSTSRGFSVRFSERGG